jgi:hypothetical protein
VETANKFIMFEYRLIIDNKPVDSRSGMLGTQTLRGFLGEEPVIVTVKQGFLGTKYALSVAGREYAFEKIH